MGMLLEKVTGPIKKWKPEGGYGFVAYGGEEFFVHIKVFPPEHRAFVEGGLSVEFSVPDGQDAGKQHLAASSAKLIWPTDAPEGLAHE